MKSFNFDLDEGSHHGPADGAPVVLHSYDLGAWLAEGKVSAWEHNSVFHRCVADHALFLGFVCDCGRVVVNPENVVQFEDGFIELR